MSKYKPTDIIKSKKKHNERENVHLSELIENSKVQDKI